MSLTFPAPQLWRCSLSLSLLWWSQCVRVCVCQASAPLLSTTVEHSTVLVQPPAHTTSLFQPHLIQEIPYPKIQHHHHHPPPPLLPSPSFCVSSLPLLPRHEDLRYQLWIKFSPGTRRRTGVRRWTSCLCVSLVLQWHRSAVQPKSFKVPSLCFSPCSAVQPAFNKTPDCLSRHPLLLATHTPSQCILYWVIYLSITPPCTPPAGSLQVQHRLMKRSAREGRER